jgi:hypothetical protein
VTRLQGGAPADGEPLVGIGGRLSLSRRTSDVAAGLRLRRHSVRPDATTQPDHELSPLQLLGGMVDGDNAGATPIGVSPQL